ncbi:MAG: secondary thiamine-phosphate synthase enzyme YjbQ [Halioglobus sp.]
MITHLTIPVARQGLHPITPLVSDVVRDAGCDEGLCSLFIQHTSASLLIQENYDESARIDLENWLNRLVPENDPLYTHTLEGPDDMPAHIKSTLTASHLSVPFENGKLLLGTWQGIYLWEHRHHSSARTVIAHVSA